MLPMCWRVWWKPLTSISFNYVVFILTITGFRLLCFENVTTRIPARFQICFIFQFVFHCRRSDILNVSAFLAEYCYLLWQIKCLTSGNLFLFFKCNCGVVPEEKHCWHWVVGVIVIVNVNTQFNTSNHIARYCIKEHLRKHTRCNAQNTVTQLWGQS